MKIVHRQIFKEHLSLFLLIGSCLLGLILVGRMLQLREMLLSQNLGVFDVLRLFFYLSPVFLLLLTPIACMLSIFLTFLRMSADRELTALKASGVSLYQLLVAPIAFGTLCTLFSLYIGLFGLSWGMEQFKHSLIEFARTKTKLSLQSGVFNQAFQAELGLEMAAQIERFIFHPDILEIQPVLKPANGSDGFIQRAALNDWIQCLRIYWGICSSPRSPDQLDV